MAKKKTDRELIKDFFDWQWPTASDEEWRTGVAVALAGLICVAGFLIYGRMTYPPGAERSDVWLAGLIFSIFVTCVGIQFVRSHYRSTDLMSAPAARLLSKVHDVKHRDLAKIWWRSYERVGKNISELRKFDLEDHHPLGGARNDAASVVKSSVSFAEIMSKSVCLLGPVSPMQDGTLQVGISRKGPTIEFNPLSVSILYMTGNQLIVYRAVADLITGDLRSESIQRIPTFEIVQVKIQTNYKRQDNGSLLKIFNRVGGLKDKELVLCETQVHIAMSGTNRIIELPVGALSVLAKKGELDHDKGASEHREARIARALDQLIESAKGAAQPGAAAR